MVGVAGRLDLDIGVLAVRVDQIDHELLVVAVAFGRLQEEVGPRLLAGPAEITGQAGVPDVSSCHMAWPLSVGHWIMICWMATSRRPDTAR